MRVYERVPVQERILRHVSMEPMSGCWLWTGNITPSGYGSTFKGFRLDKTHRTITAHRLSYEAFKGAIPSGLQLDHLCRNRCCVNPEHLEAVTAQTNQRRGVNTPASRTHCPYGHEYARTTTQRYCRECSKLNARRYRAQRRAS